LQLAERGSHSNACHCEVRSNACHCEARSAEAMTGIAAKSAVSRFAESGYQIAA
jgi:hypothetical protein